MNMLICQRIVRQTLVVLYFLLSYDGVLGEIKLSKIEDLDLEQQLNLLNKPSLKTIKTKYGDTYDCVDFYKQPAFDHPSLKNHDFHPQMKPTLARTLQNSDTSLANNYSSIWLNERGCPSGTVPIKRVTKDDLIRQRHIPTPEAMAFEAQLTNISNSDEPKRSYISSGYKRALVYVRPKRNTTFSFGGAGMSASLWNPHIIDNQQNSACRMRIFKGFDSLQAGWRVDPTLYKDKKTRFFVHFQAGNTHCFNTLCPGFVLVSSKIPLDMAFDEVTHRGDKKVLEIAMFIDRDLINGNWWLLIGDNNEQVGFWPQKLFTNLASFATNVEWGGVAYSPPGVSVPAMGSNCFPTGRPNYDAYCRRLNVLNDKGKTEHIIDTDERVDDPKMYGVYDVPHKGRGKFQHVAFYGGPGGFEEFC